MIYLDNAATTYPKPEMVYTYMDGFYRQYGGNVGRGQHEFANKASALVANTRTLILELFNCPNKKVVFTPSATESLNIVLQGLEWENEFNVYITPFEHNAVLRVLHYLSGIYKLNIIELYINKENMAYDIEKIKYQFQDRRPNVVIMSHASNVCGLVAPIKEICDLSKGYNAINVIDIAQTAGLLRIDLSDIKADFAIFAGHKTLYGPFGIAGIVMGQEAILKPLIYGGTGLDSANPELPKTIPERYEVGSLNVQAIAGLNAALKWIASTKIDEIQKKETENTVNLIRLLSDFDNIEIIGSNAEEKQVGIVSCIFNGYSSDNIGQILNNNGVAVRTGLHCAPNAHKFLGTYPNGTVRFSVGYFNTLEDFEKLAHVLEIINENS